MKRLVFSPDWETVEWYGFQRHNFQFEGHNAWIVEPDYPAGDGRWSWCAMWPEAFVKRVGVLELLAHGFYHVHIDLFDLRANDECIAIMGRFHEMLVGMGLSSKTNLIGMSWGGLYSLRYSEAFPERIAALYLDAPMCNAADPGIGGGTEERIASICENCGMTRKELETAPFNPINNVTALVKGGFPILAAVGEDDQIVHIDTNFNIFEKRLIEAGGKIEVIRREAWGHHPHGLDDPEKLLAFHWAARE